MTSLTDPFVAALVSIDWAVPTDRRLFAPFLGSWDLTVSWYGAGGELLRREAGEWHFAIVLGGRAVQDIWIVPPRRQGSEAGTYEYGTSLRFYDETDDVWRSTWVGPVQGMVRTFLAGNKGDRIVMTTTADVSPTLRWTFYDILPDAFRWQNEVSTSAGWQTQQRFEAVRHRV